MATVPIMLPLPQSDWMLLGHSRGGRQVTEHEIPPVRRVSLFVRSPRASAMEGSEKALQALSLVAIVVLTAVVFDLISEPDEDVEVVYVMVDNRIVFEENTTVIELDRSEVARIASFNIKVFGDTKMSNAVVVAELVELFQAYDMVAVQEIKDIDEEVPYLFLDELNGVAGQGNVTDQTLNWSMVLSERSRPTGGRQDLAGTVCLLLPAHGVQGAGQWHLVR